LRQFVLIVAFATLGVAAFAQDIDCSNAQTQIDLTQCAGIDFEAADAELNVSYRAAISEMEAIDAQVPSGAEGAVEALRTAQRAWISVRDNTCIAEGYTWFGGTGQSMVELNCQTRLTRIRIEDLNLLTQTY